jgi:hypothetical protein
MLQALLEDRFNAKLHRETREIPVYFLTVDKGGLKLKPFPEGSCTPIDRVSFFSTFPPPELRKLSAGDRFCRDDNTSNGPNRVVDVPADNTTHQVPKSETKQGMSGRSYVQVLVVWRS